MKYLRLLLIAATSSCLALNSAAALSGDRCETAAARRQLEQVYVDDQASRVAGSNAVDLDSQNQAALSRIVKACGWPGRSVFGKRATMGAFLVLQHADLAMQRTFLPLVRRAHRDNELPAGTLPLLEDRILVREGKPQRYGTQVDASGWPLPVEDPENLDRRRLAVGLTIYAEYWAMARERTGQDPAYIPFWWLLDEH